MRKKVYTFRVVRHVQVETHLDMTGAEGLALMATYAPIDTDQGKADISEELDIEMTSERDVQNIDVDKVGEMPKGVIFEGNTFMGAPFKGDSER